MALDSPHHDQTDQDGEQKAEESVTGVLRITDKPTLGLEKHGTDNLGELVGLEERKTTE